MTDLVVIVPSRGRPRAVVEMAESFKATCRASTRILVAVDSDDPLAPKYRLALTALAFRQRVSLVAQSTTSMVAALNEAVLHALMAWPQAEAIAFMGDDHRPRHTGWDAAYLDALRERPGFVYGNDLLQGANLPTQVAVSASVVAALGHMAPPVLRHMYVDNYWLALGQAADCITYLPDVVVEHLHPVAGKAQWDEGYVRVNNSAVYQADQEAFTAYLRDNLAREVELVRATVAGARA